MEAKALTRKPLPNKIENTKCLKTGKKLQSKIYNN